MSIDTNTRNVLKEKLGKWYRMWYNAIILYFDKNDNMTSRFYLLSDSSADPTQEQSIMILCVSVRVRSCVWRCKRRHAVPPLISGATEINDNDYDSSQFSVEEIEDIGINGGSDGK